MALSALPHPQPATEWMSSRRGRRNRAQDTHTDEPLQRSPDMARRRHAVLDAAVATAYGWPADISDDDALAELLALNLANGR